MIFWLKIKLPNRPPFSQFGIFGIVLADWHTGIGGLSDLPHQLIKLRLERLDRFIKIGLVLLQLGKGSEGLFLLVRVEFRDLLADAVFLGGDVLKFLLVLDEFGETITLASSFGAEDQVLTDMVIKANPKAAIPSTQQCT